MAKVVLVAAAALVDRDGRILLAQRSDGSKLNGLWEFPGGKLESGETPEKALIRELREELGVETEESCLAPIAFASETMENFHLLMPLFVCRKWRGSPRPIAHSALKWARANELMDYKMPPADRPLAAQLRDIM